MNLEEDKYPKRYVMFNLQKSIVNITRHKPKSVLTVLICALLVLFLFLFMGSLSANTRQLAALPDAMPVYARVSNLNGTFYDNLLVTDTRIRGLEVQQYYISSIFLLFI